VIQSTIQSVLNIGCSLKAGLQILNSCQLLPQHLVLHGVGGTNELLFTAAVSVAVSNEPASFSPASVRYSADLRSGRCHYSARQSMYLCFDGKVISWLTSYVS